MVGFENKAFKVIKFDSIKKKWKSNEHFWVCICKHCGNESIRSTRQLNLNNTKGCGCFQKFINKGCTHGIQFKKIHGLIKHPLYRSWTRMKERCYGLKSDSILYPYYFGKGIKVCDEWKTDFMNFYHWSLNNGWKNGLSLDRIDSSKDYSPENCQWLTRSDHSRKTNNDNLKVGSKNPISKLNESQVILIKQMLSKGYKGNYIAKEFSITKQVISGIKNGKSWKHVK